MNDKLSIYEILVIALLAVSLAGCATAPVTPPCALGECFALQQGTAAWVMSTTFWDTSYHLISLQSIPYPNQIVTFARLSGGVAMAGVDLSTQHTLDLAGTWMHGKDFTSILNDALGSGNWRIIEPRQVADKITVRGIEGYTALLVGWLSQIAFSAETTIFGAMVIPENLFDWQLEKIGFSAGEPG